MDENTQQGLNNDLGSAQNTESFVALTVKRNNRPVQKKKGRGGRILFIILLLAAAAVIAAVVITRSSRDINMNESNVLFSKSFEVSSGADFYTCGSNVYYATRNSISLLDQKGSQKWTDSYTMISPVMLGDNDAVAVAEKNGTAIRMYNKDGYMYDVSFNEPVITFAVNGMGCLAVIAKSDSNYELSVYDGSGKALYGGNFAAKDGIPTAMDISSDGKILAVGFININNIKLQSNVLFYHLDGDEYSGSGNAVTVQNTEENGEVVTASESVGQNSGAFASVVFKDSLLFKLSFASGNACVALADNKAAFIKPSDNSEIQSVEVPFSNRITYSCVNGDGTVAIALGEPLLNAAEPEESNTVIWYGANGEKISSYTAQKDITGLFPGENVTVVGMDRSFEALKTKGGSAWQYTATQDTVKVLAYNGDDKMLRVTAVDAVAAKVSKGNNLIEADEEQAVTKAPEEGQGEAEAATENTASEEAQTAAETEARVQTETEAEAQTEPQAQEKTESSAAEQNQ